MIDTEINIAIAEACGKLRRVMTKEECEKARKEWQKEEPTPYDELTYPQEWEGTIPNYCHDLNDMHEAEKTLDGTAKASDYEIELRAVIVRHSFIRLAPGQDPVVGNFRLLHATARQRAEAFLRTVGRWKE